MAVAAQLVNSASSLLLLMFAARSMSQHDFGIVALIWALYALAMSFERLAFGEQALAMTASQSEVQRLRRVSRRWHLRVVLLLVIAGVVGLVLSDPDSAWLWLLPLLSVVSLQADRDRFLSFAERASGSVLLGDAYRLALLVGGLLAAHYAGIGPLVFISCWGLGAGLQALVLGSTHGRAHVEQTEVQSGLSSSHRTYVRWLLVQFVFGTTPVHFLPLAVAALVSVADYGGLRAAQQVTLPLIVAAGALNMVLIPWLSAQRGGRGVAFAALRVTTILATISVLLVAGVIWVGPNLLAALYGPEFVAFGDLLLPMAIVGAVGATAVPGGTALRVLRRGRDITVGQMSGLAVGLPTVLVLTQLAGVTGAAWGMALQASLTAVAIHVLLLRTWADHRDETVV